jgi:1-acyl-sn-glycerol-3-phosphate acyltransferase
MPFKKGPFFLAEETRAPIVPIAISGTQHMMRKGSVAITPGVVTLQFLAPIEPSAYATREEMMSAVRAALIAALPPEMQPIE